MPSDEHYMRIALDLAAKGRGRTSPNPLVGAVVVKTGHIVGQGWHHCCGGPHAETLALRQAGSRAIGATLYVNLEPCAHAGRTPPCVDAVLDAGIQRVIVAMKDPNPQTNGRSLARLRRAGVEVRSGVLQADARKLNQAFLTWITQGRPHVTAKSAQTIDGKIATASGASQWITSPVAREWARRQRDDYDAILVGINTVLADNPRLNAARPGKPLRKVVLDSRLQISPRARLFQDTQPGQCLVVTARTATAAKRKALEKQGVHILMAPVRASGLDISWVLQELARLDITSVLIEGGGRVIGSALKARVIDRYLVFIAPTILGDETARPSVAGLRITSLARACTLADTEVSRRGPDIVLHGRVVYPKT